MKREELYRTKYRSESDFRSAVDKYMIFYNTKRPHKKLQYKTPEQKEEEYALKLKDFWDTCRQTKGFKKGLLLIFRIAKSELFVF